MKRYLVFAGDSFYPNGGFLDFKYSFVRLEEAEELVKKIMIDEHWYQIVDIKTGKIISQVLPALSEPLKP